MGVPWTAKPFLLSIKPQTIVVFISSLRFTIVLEKTMPQMKDSNMLDNLYNTENERNER